MRAPGGGRAEGVRRLFDRAAGTYDALNHLFSLNIDRAWRRVLVRMADLPPGARILDACCGTGDLAVTLARSVPGATVLGVDFSQRMLELGRAKVARLGLAQRVRLVRGDVLRLDPPHPEEARFDAAGIAFGLRNLSDRLLGLSRLARLLRPGGKLMVLEFTPPPQSLWGGLFRLYLGRVMPLLGGVISGSAGTYRYLYSSVLDFLRPEEVSRLMVEAGVGRVSVRRLSGGICHAWVGVRPGISPLP